MTTPDWLPPPMLPPSVSVFSGGVQLSDGRVGGSPLAPMVLSGLRVQWGRATILDQPSPSTCNLTLLDETGGQSFRDVIGIGKALDVRADALIYPDPGQPGSTVMIDLPFTSGPVPAAMVVQNGSASVTGGQLRVIATTPDRAVVITFTPGVPQPVGGNPAAWDAIARAAPGQSWLAATDVILPALFAGYSGWRAEVMAVSFDAPWAPGTAQPPAIPISAGNTHSGTYVPNPGLWQGIRVTVWPTGPAWVELDTTAWSALPPTVTWQDLATYRLDNVKLTAPPAGTQRSALVFSGRVTDMEARFDTGSGATLIDVTGQDQRAELANRDVGDIPWLAETLGARVARIITASGQKIGYSIDTSMQSLPVSWRDVDRQGALTLLQEMAISGDGVLWAAASLTTGPYLDFESLGQRPALSGLSQGADSIVIIGPITNVPGSLKLEACSLSRDPVRWIQDVADVSTRVAVTWRDQTLDTQGNPAPTDRVVTVSDSQLESTVGTRRIAISTQLANTTPAQNLASNTLGRTSTPGWRLSGLVWEADTDAPLDKDELTRMMTLLDGTTRNGAPIVVTDLPLWSPVPGKTEVPLFVEGGTYVSRDGAWELDMVTSAPTAAGVSCRWVDMPSTPHPVTIWRWQDFSPTIRWVDLAGVAVT
jgi:hypothetical protein